MNNGTFIISLDFELFWGLLDSVDYNKNFRRIEYTRNVVEELINFFEDRKIKVSWSTVGLLFLKNSDDLNDLLPNIKQPRYLDKNLNNYNNFFKLRNDKNFLEEVFFANDLVQKLKKSEFQYIGSHTFSHYYCLEEGQTIKEFDNDIKTVKKIAELENIQINSIVFPRNQYNKNYLNILKAHNIISYRGNPDHYIYKARKSSSNNLIVKGLRLLDTYINITGQITHKQPVLKNGMYNIKASRFLRPINNKNKYFKKLQLKRIKNEMTHAAKHNRYFHLWWHPHNFSRSPSYNFEILKEIIEHFYYLNDKFNFETESMESYVEKVESYEKNNYDM